ncbi:MAG: CRISPR-associated protein Csx16 [Betaproteobacteria bacterium]|nr:CRISPR-associated protein Csx16 [Betaproteobacteria bacterium]
MTIWFITRHPGAIEWAARHGIAWDRHVPHLDPEEVAAGDTVIGSLPVHLAAAICARGAGYFNLSLDMPAHLRGRELDADVLEACGARLEKYFVKKETP